MLPSSISHIAMRLLVGHFVLAIQLQLLCEIF
jgi:hypothetical protein